MVVAFEELEDGMKARVRPLAELAIVQEEDADDRPERVVVGPSLELLAERPRPVVECAIPKRRALLGLHLDVEEGAILEDGEKIEDDSLVEHGLAPHVGVENGHLGDRALWAEHRCEERAKNARALWIGRQQELEDDIERGVEQASHRVR